MDLFICVTITKPTNCPGTRFLCGGTRALLLMVMESPDIPSECRSLNLAALVFPLVCLCDRQSVRLFSRLHLEFLVAPFDPTSCQLSLDHDYERGPNSTVLWAVNTPYFCFSFWTLIICFVVAWGYSTCENW